MKLERVKEIERSMLVFHPPFPYIYLFKIRYMDSSMIYKK